MRWVGFYRFTGLTESVSLSSVITFHAIGSSVSKKSAHRKVDLIRRKQMDSDVGSTGQFPRGKIHKSDEGELQMVVNTDPNTGTIIVGFGKPVAWIGLDVTSAQNLVDVLVKRIDELKKH